MGYEAAITRDPEGGLGGDDDISLAEWLAFVEAHPAYRAASEGLTVWRGYSKHQEAGAQAAFLYEDGHLLVKNPDLEVLREMHRVATVLGAYVVGEDGELYDAEGRSETEREMEAEAAAAPKKPWWRFW